MGDEYEVSRGKICASQHQGVLQRNSGCQKCQRLRIETEDSLHNNNGSHGKQLLSENKPPVLSVPGAGIQGSGIAAIPQSVIAGGKNPRSTIAIRDCG